MSFDRNTPSPGMPARPSPTRSPVEIAIDALALAPLAEHLEAERLYLQAAASFAHPQFSELSVMERWAWVQAARTAGRAGSGTPEVPARLTRDGPPTGYPAG